MNVEALESLATYRMTALLARLSASPAGGVSTQRVSPCQEHGR
jgi:hypothetical protein